MTTYDNLAGLADATAAAAELDDPTAARHAGCDTEALQAALLKLSPRQRLALDALATGSTHTDAAAAAGVTRLAVQSAEGVRAIRGRAVAVVLDRLDAPDTTLADALAALKLVGLPELGHTPDTPTAIELLDIERRDTAATAERPPRARELGHLLAEMDGSAERVERARIDRLTLTRLADAADLDLADLDPAGYRQ